MGSKTTGTAHKASTTLTLKNYGQRAPSTILQFESYQPIHTETTNPNFILPVNASAGVTTLTGPAVHVPVKAVQELLGSAERCRTRKGPDICGSTKVSIDYSGTI